MSAATVSAAASSTASLSARSFPRRGRKRRLACARLPEPPLKLRDASARRRRVVVSAIKLRAVRSAFARCTRAASASDASLCDTTALRRAPALRLRCACAAPRRAGRELGARGHCHLRRRSACIFECAPLVAALPRDHIADSRERASGTALRRVEGASHRYAAAAPPLRGGHVRPRPVPAHCRATLLASAPPRPRCAPATRARSRHSRPHRR